MTEAPTPVLKILTVSLADVSKYKAYAVFNGEQLIITHITQLRGMFNTWRDDLIKEVASRVDAGFAVLVEEKTEVVSQYGTRYMLEDRDGEDVSRSNYFDALDWYFALLNTDSIVFHPDCKNFLIRPGGEGQRVEKIQDDKGKVSYRVDWNNFNGGYRAMLLCVVAAMTEPLSARYLDAMYGPEAEEEERYNWQRVFRAITWEYDEKKRIAWMEAEDKILDAIRDRNGGLR